MKGATKVVATRSSCPCASAKFLITPSQPASLLDRQEGQYINIVYNALHTIARRGGRRHHRSIHAYIIHGVLGVHVQCTLRHKSRLNTDIKTSRPEGICT